MRCLPNFSLLVVYGHVYAWGYGKACGFKTDVLSPLCVYSCTKRDKLLDMAGGDSHSLILLSSGTIYSWGNNFEVMLMENVLVIALYYYIYAGLESK